jgi:hypothetical protein
MRNLILLALLAFAGCSADQVAAVCAQDATLQPQVAAVVTAGAPVVALAAPQAAPVAGVAVVAVQVDSAAVHPAIQAECAKLMAAPAPAAK